MATEHLDRNYKRAAWIVTLALLVATFAYGLEENRVRGALALVLVSLASLALGGFTGFLFGLPKALTETAPPDSPHKHAYATNTNLEQVSDWLTKILVGLGLTQLQQLPGVLRDLGDYISQTFVPATSPAVIVALLISFAILGFITAYLLTKFDLADLIDEHDGLIDVVKARPDDREAVEALMLSSLYKPSPAGYQLAIQTGEAFLAQEGHPSEEDATVFGYLACGYGQQYADAKAKGAPTTTLVTIRNAVVDAANNAIAREKNWAAKLRGFANPPVNGVDDDLAALKEDPELKPLLAGDVIAKKTRDQPVGERA